MIMAMLFLSSLATAQADPDAQFDGSKWNVSTGNLSVQFIQASPIGAYPRPGYFIEPPPPVDELKQMKKQGLVCYEDYVAWGAVEREPGKWDWTQHDRVYEAIHAAGLKYVVYNWVHFPPVWLREGSDRTLMKCLEHGEEINYLSIFDPRTIEHYDHFYKALSEHFGDRIEAVYACILGPYGEGNYPLLVPEFVNMGPCHEGYWCADPYARAAFRDAMRGQYESIGLLNSAWGTDYKSFSELKYPAILYRGAKPSPSAFGSAQERRQWLDFITWYHQTLIDFAEESVKVTLRYFPKEKVRMKPGGNAGGVNPIAWGTYSPGYAKMAGKYGITLQPADCHGAYFGDKWVGTAYSHYGVKLSTEPAGNLSPALFAKRMYSDACCGAAQLFTYEFTKHAEDIRRYVHLYTGRPSETSVAVLCPTTLYRLGGDIGHTIRLAAPLRDLLDYDVIDELLIADGILDQDNYKTVIILQGDYIEQSILDRLEKWVRRGGMLIVGAQQPIVNVEGTSWMEPDARLNPGEAMKVGKGEVLFVDNAASDHVTPALSAALANECVLDGKADGVWSAIRSGEVVLLNTTSAPVEVECPPGSGIKLQVPAGVIATAPLGQASKQRR